MSLLSKWNLITRYPVIFNFQVGMGRVLEKKFGTGRVPGSRRTLDVTRPISISKLQLFYYTSRSLCFCSCCIAFSVHISRGMHFNCKKSRRKSVSHSICWDTRCTTWWHTSWQIFMLPFVMMMIMMMTGKVEKEVYYRRKKPLIMVEIQIWLQ